MRLQSADSAVQILLPGLDGDERHIIDYAPQGGPELDERRAESLQVRGVGRIADVEIAGGAC